MDANVNGWNIPGLTISGGKGKIEMGVYGTDYLLHAAIAKFGLFGNSLKEAVCHSALTDNHGQNLTGMDNYVIHFDPGQTLPVDAFWALTMYKNVSIL